MTEKTIKIETVGPGPLYIVKDSMTSNELASFLNQWERAIEGGQISNKSAVILSPMDIESVAKAHVIMCNDTPIEVCLSLEVAEKRREELQEQFNKEDRRLLGHRYVHIKEVPFNLNLSKEDNDDESYNVD